MKLAFRLVPFLASLACVAVVAAKTPTLEDLVHEYTLDNGLTLLVVENHDSPTIGTVTVFAVGGAEEKPGNHGVTHILEHMLFKGTTEIGTTDWEAERPHHERIEELHQEMLRERAKTKPDEKKIEKLLAERDEEREKAKSYAVDNELDKFFSEAGGVNTNAFTSYDITAYIQAIPSNRLDLWMYLESQRLKDPVLRQFYTEVENVQEERRLRTDGDPGGLLSEQFLALAYDHHGYGFSLIGLPEDISNVTRTESEEWFKIYYAPNRMTIALVGDVDPDEVHQKVKDYFGDIERQEPPVPLETKDLPLRGERRVQVEYDAEPQLLMGWHKVNVPHPDDATLRVISEILTGGRSSRLERVMVEEMQITASISTDHEYPGSRWDNLFVIEALPRAPHTTADAEEAIWRELERLKREPVTERELEKAKNRIKASRVREIGSNFWTAVQLGAYQASFGDWRVMLEGDDRVAEVTAEDIQRVAAMTFKRNATVVATLVEPSFEADPAKEAAAVAHVDKMVKALGGDGLSEIETARMMADIKLTTPMGEITAEGRVLLGTPNKVRSETAIAAFGVNQVQGSDGQNHWQAANGQVETVEGDDAKKLEEDVERDMFLLAYPKVANNYILQDVTEEGGAPTVEVRGPSGKPFLVVFGDDSLPAAVKYDGTHPMTGDPAAFTEEFGDFRAVSGVKRPHHIVTKIDGEPFADTTVKEITINGSVAADEFSPPAG